MGSKEFKFIYEDEDVSIAIEYLIISEKNTRAIKIFTSNPPETFTINLTDASLRKIIDKIAVELDNAD